ncbi:PREDICTED: hemK methyltransferase family member 2 [Nicrophorus vespilloides]|uniref:HemK methyltransferase family member 2 n=1 Tax=Nicrophorus vespilloides TaxID=110193 RepID=A0ABM1N5W6_NICVS|nr:PREDICTED: hemK methyltransferase family member 2 [Nicrophorus vespilloides]
MHLQTAEYDLSSHADVYEPSEDSFLFLDALEEEFGNLVDLKPLNIVEIGSGSGVIITSLAKALKNANFFAVDINMSACKATQMTGELNATAIQPLCMDLLGQFKENMFDVIVFNPPYVVTDSEELCGNGINRAWAGGKDGREIIDKLLPKIPNILSCKGIFYLLLLKENKPKEVIDFMFTLGFAHKIIKERKLLGEYLYIVKFNK